jgi:two-component system, chemotaxis family, sensor kinase CheA
MSFNEKEAEEFVSEADEIEVSSIRVPVALLDSLMTLMGEMVLVRNQVLQYSSKSEDLELLSMSKRLNVVTSEIQGEMMKTRMQPIGNVLSKFNRVVRDISQELGKNITLNLHGTEIELDKSLLEAIKDPLTHIVRNSCDHGIETPEVRKQGGKSNMGVVDIKAYHEGGQVIIDIADNGKGLNKDVLLKKALENGLLNSTTSNKLSEKEIFNLIFAPGFSTATKVTNLSGRGVGMDVVRTNIERIGGTVELSSVTGAGTSIKIKIPLTLAIVPALIVKCGTGTFAIPQVKLEELIRVDQSTTQNKFEFLHGSPVYRLRGNILPLVDLNNILQLDQKTKDSYENKTLNIAVLNAEQNSFGIIIDEIQDTADIVVKPLNRLIKSLQVYSGATVLGDGSIALILDVLGMSKVAQINRAKILTNDACLDLSETKKHDQEIQDFILLKLNSRTKHALPLVYVNRIEEFKAESVEYSGLQRVIRYHDAILPLISASEQLGYGHSSSAQEAAILSVIVVEKAGVLYGLEVDQIIDSLKTNIEINTNLNSHAGIFGNINTKEELIVVINPFELIAKAFPEIHAEVQAQPKLKEVQAVVQTHHNEIKNILLVEDTAFFRKAIKAVLDKAGFNVTIAYDGQDAVDFLNRNQMHIDMIVSDIEMPRMNGFSLAEYVRKHPKYREVPMLAISSRADKDFMSAGKKAGFNLYLEKLKPEILISSMNELILSSKKAV